MSLCFPPSQVQAFQNLLIAVLLLRSVVVNSSGNKVGGMFGSTERVLCSLEMLGMLNGNES